jgi:hypothetical protein
MRKPDPNHPGQLLRITFRLRRDSICTPDHLIYRNAAKRGVAQAAAKPAGHGQGLQ